MKNKILVTGAAGFIGYHLSQKLIEKNEVIGIDNINDYYDTNLKEDRINLLNKKSSELNKKWTFLKGDIEDKVFLKKIFESYKPSVVFNLAAQAGVRYSLVNPEAYIRSNILGFLNVIECCKLIKVKHFIYASSSSVYGGNEKVPFSEKDPVNHPISVYAATKKSNELIAHSYSHLYNLPSTGLRFFTVYGPWGRPDMAPMIFAQNIINNKPLKIFNNGYMYRDFTYIDDVIKAMINLINVEPKPNKNFSKICPDPSTSWAPHRILNIGNNQVVSLMDFINYLEQEIGQKAKKEFQAIQPGDVEKTFADTSAIKDLTGFKPNTPIKEGIKKFIKWFKTYYS